MFVSCLHPEAVLNDAFCMTCSLLMLAEDGRGDPKRHSIQVVELSQRIQTAVQIVSKPPDLPVFGKAGYADLLDGWRCSS